MKKAETIRGENWLKISERVLDHIESYTIPQYGDAPNDSIEGWSVEECFKQTERYLARRNTSMRHKEKALDILKSIHYLSLSLEKIEKEAVGNASKLSDLLCPLASIRSAMVFASKDWSEEKVDAWIYGVIVGWDNESLVELRQKFNWSDEIIDRLGVLHNNFKKLST